MENIYLTVCYDLGRDYEHYVEMLRLSYSSVIKYVPNISRSEVLTNLSGTRNPYEMLREVFRASYDLWLARNNVLFIEIDALVVKPLDIWTRFEEFRMFTPTSPPRFRGFDPYLNCGVRYFPATMSKHAWTLGFDMLGSYDESFWGYDQVIYNAMFYSQGIKPEIIPGLNYLMIQDPGIDRSITWEDASILHFVSSRGAKKCLQRMEGYYGRLCV